jgi:hypothetical protein
MIRLCIIFLFITLPVLTYGQGWEFHSPDYETIKKSVADKSSAYYYPKLMKRYEHNDTTLNKDDYNHLYYGYFFRDDHSSFEGSSNINDDLKKILEQEAYSDKDRKEIIRLSRKYLETNPFDLRKLNYIRKASMDLHDTLTYSLYSYKIRKIIGTIMHSGDGKTDETGFHVLDVSHEYYILNSLGYQFVSQTLTQHPCDYLQVKSNPDGVEGIYFDVSQIFKGYHKLFDETPKKKKR